MAVGMGTVLGFLTLIVIVMNLSARFFDSFGHRWLPDAATERSDTTPHATGSVAGEIAVTLAAIESHRRQQR